MRSVTHQAAGSITILHNTYYGRSGLGSARPSSLSEHAQRLGVTLHGAPSCLDLRRNRAPRKFDAPVKLSHANGIAHREPQPPEHAQRKNNGRRPTVLDDL